MTGEKKYEAVRLDGIEVLRACRELCGFEGVPKRIGDFYESLAECSAKGALEHLKGTALSELEGARAEGARALAFFRRYNYTVECRAEPAGDGYLRVALEVRLSKGASELYYVKNVHFWSVSEENMIGENGFKKALSRQEKIVKK